MSVAKTLVLFTLAAVAEIGGAWLVWQGTREHRGALFVGAGVAALGAFTSRRRPEFGYRFLADEVRLADMSCRTGSCGGSAGTIIGSVFGTRALRRRPARRVPKPSTATDTGTGSARQSGAAALPTPSSPRSGVGRGVTPGLLRPHVELPAPERCVSVAEAADLAGRTGGPFAVVKGFLSAAQERWLSSGVRSHRPAGGGTGVGGVGAVRTGTDGPVEVLPEGGMVLGDTGHRLADGAGHPDPRSLRG